MQHVNVRGCQQWLEDCRSIQREVTMDRFNISPLRKTVLLSAIVAAVGPGAAGAQTIEKRGTTPNGRFTSINGHNVGEFYLRCRPLTLLGVMRVRRLRRRKGG